MTDLGLSLSLCIVCVALMFGLKLEVWVSWSEEHITEFEVSTGKQYCKINEHDLRYLDPILVVVAGK